MNDQGLRQRLAWLIGIRVVIATLLLDGATWAQVAALQSFPVDPFMALSGVTYALTIVYALTIGFAERRPWVVELQLAIDIVIVTVFIWVTGGVASFSSSLYSLPIIGATVVRYRRGGLSGAALAAVLYVGLVVAQYTIAGNASWGIWFPVGSGLPTTAVAEFTVGLNVFGFFAIAMLSGSLGEHVRSTDLRLERASNEIEDLQAFNQDVINSLPSGLVTTDRSQRILTFNHAAEVITGWSRSSVIGRSVADVLQFSPALAATFNDGLEGTGVRRLDLRHRTADGRDLEVGLSATNLETHGGRAGFLITFQDLTEIKKLERDAQIQQRLAAVGEMAAGIAHEIRNPLASMSGSIQILRQELPLTSEQEQLMDIVLRESERLNNTIRTFLAYARPQRFAIERFDVRRALSDTALLLRNSAEVHEGHKIDVDAPDEEVWCEADEAQIRQVVWNLATNGLRAMPDGGRLRLSAHPETASAAVVISVMDDGIGIAAEDLDGLFQPFHGTFAVGSGLGLAIVHRIVNDYHGAIDVRSRLGAGTTVSVRLPDRADAAP